MIHLGKINGIIENLGSIHLSIFNSLLWWSTNSCSQFLTCFSLQFFNLHGRYSSKLSVLSLMYCIVLSIKLFSKEEWIWWSSFGNLQACGYQVPPSVDTGCLPWILTKSAMNRYAINMFLPLDMFSARISLFSGSIATQIQIYWEPIFISVSSTTYSDIFLLRDEFFEVRTFESNSIF